jgi:hypothetical protein
MQTAYVRHQFDASLDQIGLSTYVEILKSALSDVDSAFSCGISMILKLGNADDLLEVDLSPHSYNTPTKYYMDAQLLALIKKFPFHVTSVNPTRACAETFLLGEKRCEGTNIRYTSNRRDKFSSATSSIIHEARRQISRLLGDVPHVTSLDVAFGPGAAYSVSKYTSPYHKMKSTMDVTPRAFTLAMNLLSSCPSWCHALGVHQDDEAGISDLLNIVPGSKLTTVPKTAKTDRPICI